MNTGRFVSRPVSGTGRSPSAWRRRCWSPGCPGSTPPARASLLGYVLLAAGGLALVARRRAPVAVLAVTGLCAVGYQAAGFEVLAVAYLFAVYGAVRAGHRALTVAASVALLVVLPLTALALPRRARARGVRAGPERPRNRLADRRLCRRGGAAAGRAAGGRGRAHPGGDRAAPRRRGAAAHRAGAARFAHPPDLDHQGAVRGRRPRGPQARRTGAGGPAGDPGGRTGGDPGAARDPGGPARRRHDPAAGPRRRTGTGGARPFDRPGRDADDRRATARRAGRGGPDRLPHRPGVADQHRPARLCHHRVGPDRLPARRPRRPGRRRRQGHPRHAPGRPASGCSACANASPPSAAGCARNRAPSTASPSTPNSPWNEHHDPCPAGRRPAAHPQRLPRAARPRGRHRGGGRGRRRRRGLGARRGSICPTSRSSTSRCRSWTASRRPGASPRTRPWPACTSSC